MEYNLEKIVLEVLKEYLPLIQSGKDRFTPDDISERYGIHADNARRMMNNGCFGNVISITPRNKVVTLEGLLTYEAEHTGLMRKLPEEKAQRLKSTKNRVGRL